MFQLYKPNLLDRKYRWIVFSRDNFCCQRCKIEGEIYDDLWEVTCSLAIHHVNGNSSDNKLENLISLCLRCHLKVHDGCWRNKPREFFSPKQVDQRFVERVLAEYDARLQAYRKTSHYGETYKFYSAV